jgi:hypothetical protein
MTRRPVGIPGTPVGQYYSGPFTGSVCKSGDPEFFSEKLMSTPEENIEILRYFGKGGILIRIQPAKIAGLYGSLFFNLV